MEEVTALILENEKLIYKCASYFRNNGNIDDLYQAGCLGILKAYENYDDSYNTKFSTYAYSYIIGEMKKLVREDKAIKVNRDLYNLRGKIEEARSRLSQILMHSPSDKELSEFLEISEEELAEAINSSLSPKYLEDNVMDSDMMIHEIISSPSVDIDDLLYLKMEIESLDEPDRSIMINRYFEDMTQKETADNLGLSQVFVSRSQNKVLTKLKQM